MRVLYVYEAYLMTYECMKVGGSGQCEPGMDNVMVYSKSGELPEDAVEVMLELSDQSCYTKEDFVPAGHSSELQLLDIDLAIV
jgi:hypothetical protein